MFIHKTHLNLFKYVFVFFEGRIKPRNNPPTNIMVLIMLRCDFHNCNYFFFKSQVYLMDL